MGGDVSAKTVELRSTTQTRRLGLHDSGILVKRDVGQNQMRVRVLFFGILKDLAERAADAVELPAGATVGELLVHYERQFPKLRELFPSVALSVNQEYAGPEVELHADDEVGLLPPVSGGCVSG